MKKKRAGKSKRLSMDIISTLPETILETILSLLPTEEAARTSILSKEWRYKWTKISKLKFLYDKLHVANTGTDMDLRCKFFYGIHQVLLLHQGPIHELTLEFCDHWDRFEFEQIMLHLAKNHMVKKLTLNGWDTDPVFDLPISVFSLDHLTDLSLAGLELEDQTIFNVIGSLRSLVLHHVGISTKTLLHLLSNCPSLKKLYLHIGDKHHGERCTIVELFKCLPVIEHLTTYQYDVMCWLDLGLVPQELPSLHFPLKYFCLEQMSFDDGYCLPFLLVLVKSSPNLEKIKLEIEWDDDDDYDEYSVVWEEYSDVWLENLFELEIKWFRNLKLEMEFVKFILARSPKLKKLRIHSGVSEKEKLKMIEVLLETPCASPVRIYV